MDKYLSFDQSLLTFYSFNICLFLFFFQKKKKKKKKEKKKKNREIVLVKTSRRRQTGQPGQFSCSRTSSSNRAASSCDLLIIRELISRSCDPDEWFGEREQKKKGSGTGIERDWTLWHSVVKKKRDGEAEGYCRENERANIRTDHKQSS